MFSEKWRLIDEYVIVFCHSLLKGTDPNNPNHWFYTKAQEGTNLIPLILAQIRWAIQRLIENERCVVIFSGGYTRGDWKTDPVFCSEADSYMKAALQLGGIESEEQLRRILTEPCARNSLENLIFGVACGFEVTGVRPKRITCAGFESKRQRVLTHAKIAGFAVEGSDPAAPGPIVSYVGINDFDGEKLRELQLSEVDFLKKLQAEPQGMGALAKVRYQDRNPYQRPPRYLAAARDWPHLLGQLAIAYGPDGVEI